MTSVGRLLLASLCWQLGSNAAEQAEAPAGALASLATVEDDFKRNALLYPLVATADAADLQRLFAELARQPATPHRYDIARVLYIRFVAVDPAAAVHHALHRTGKPSWINAVFRAWAHVDLEAAVARAADLDGEAAQVAAAAIFELDLNTEQRAFVVAQLGGERQAQHADVWATYASGADDMAAAWNRALHAGADMREQLRAIAAAWAAVEPRQAMAMAAKLDPSLRDSLELVIIGHWDTADPTGPIEWLEQASPQNRGRYLVRRAMAHLAQSDLDIALARVEELPEAMREAALQGVLQYMAAQAPQRAFEHFRSLDFATQAATLVQVAFFVPPHADNVAWVATLHPRLRSEALGMILHRMHIADPALAVRLTDDMPNARLKAHWVRSLAPREVRRDPHQAWAWATSLPNDLQEASGVVNTAFSTWYAIDRDSAARNLLALRESPVRDQALLAVIRHFADAPSKYDHSLIDRFLRAISEAAVRREAAGILRDHYTSADPNPRLAERYRKSE